MIIRNLTIRNPRHKTFYITPTISVTWMKGYKNRQSIAINIVWLVFRWCYILRF